MLALEEVGALDPAPSYALIEEEAARLARKLIRTPVVPWATPAKEALIGRDTRVHCKLELMQLGGSFKTRGVMAIIESLADDAKGRGVLAVSGGNHGVAVAFAARQCGVKAKIVLFKSVARQRIAACRELGADVVLADDIFDAFRLADDIRKREAAFFIHPYESFGMVLGSATLGYEFSHDVAGLDVIFAAVGGGGHCAGVAAAVKQGPNTGGCRVYGVEPEGADSMHQSFVAGRPVELERVTTIADTLGAPRALPYSFGVCRKYVDGLVRVSDDELRAAVDIIWRDFKLAVEPACAAGLAAVIQQRNELQGLRVGVIFCGSNIDPDSYLAARKLQ